MAASFAVTMTLGEAMFTFGLFLKPLQAEFDWNRALTSSAYSLFLLGYSLSCIVSGRFADKYHPRPVVLAGAILGGAGMALSGLINNIFQFQTTMFIAGLGAGVTWAVPTSLVQRWFANRRRAGLALSLVTCGGGVGAFLYPPFISWLITSYGWREAYLIKGAMLLVVTGAGALLMKNVAETPAVKAANQVNTSFVSSLKTMFANRSFIAILFAMIAGAMIIQSVSSQLIAFATDEGVSAVAAAFAISVIGAVSIPGRLIAGVIADRLGWRIVYLLSLCAMGGALIILILYKGEIGLFVFVAAYGFAHGLRMPSGAGVLGEFFGTKQLGMLIGLTSAVSQMVAVTAPYLCGFVYDTTGHYDIAFILLATLVSGGALTIFFLKNKRPEISST